MQGFKDICTYIDDKLIITKVDWSYHLEKCKVGLINEPKMTLNGILKHSFLVKQKWNAFFLVTHQSVQAIISKATAITHMKSPTDKHII